MLNYIIRRIGYLFVTLIFVCIIGFVIIELPPGSYLEFEIQRIRLLGGDLGQDQIRALEIQYGVGDPFPVKFWKWISRFVQGDFGESFEYNMPARTLVFARLPFTIIISVLTLVFSWTISIFVGVYSATHRRTVLDYTITTLQFIGLSVPAFLLALVIMVFAQRTLGLHVSGLYSDQYINAPWSWDKFVDLLKHIWVPIVVIGANNTAWLSRVMRSNLLDVLGMQYVQTARSKGLLERRVIWKHAVRNALHPLVMVLGMSLPQIISGETIVAIVLNLPTTGPLYFRALLQQDMYLAASFLMMLAVMLLIGNLFADILLAWLDPRIRFE